jgi:HSP20 family molecular chaperone IbpA
VTAELRGVDEKDLDVTLANGMLTIRGAGDAAPQTPAFGVSGVDREENRLPRE